MTWEISSRVLLMRGMVEVSLVVEGGGALVFSSRVLLRRGMVECSLVVEGSRVFCVFALVGER